MSQTKVQLINNVSGDSGFGTSSPAEKLVVDGAIVASGAVSNPSSYTDTGLYIQNKGSSVFDLGAWRSGASVSEISFSTDSGSDAAPVERMRLDKDGNLGIGTISPSSLFNIYNSDATAFDATATDGQVGVGPSIYLYNPANTNTTVGGQIVFGMRSTEAQCRIAATGGTTPKLTFVTADTLQVQIDSTGRMIIGSPTVNTSIANSLVAAGRIQSDGTASITTSSSANVFISSSTGLLSRSTSSSRYKKDIADATWGLADVLKLKPKTFKSNATGEDADDNTYGGFIAEDVHDIGLTNFVEYNSKDQPDAIHYGNMVSLLTKAIQELNTKITTLETKVAALEAA